MKHSVLQIGKIPVLISGIIVFLLAANAASGQIGGVVRSTADNQPIPGVTVSVKGTTRGIVTDARGQYRLGEVHPGDTIVFSAIGYQTRQRQVTSSLVVDALLEPSTESLSQLVVIGYGTQKKRDLTGSVSSVNAEKLADEHPKGLQDILRGNAAGLNVGFSASAEGGGSLEVRGRKSLNAGGTPLLVVDGVIYYGNLSDINPYDIASVDILKDASAAAVYGAKAANGVIIITTKKGVEGKPRINFNATFGLATMEVNQPVYSAQGYIRWRGDVMKATHANAQPYEYSDPRKLPSNISTDQWLAYDNSSGDPVTVWLQRLNFQPIEITNYKAGKSIDWYDKVFQTGLQQDYNVSISDKKKDLSYYWSLGYEDNDGIIVGDGFKTVRSRLNLQSKITKFLEVGLNTQFSIRDESQIPVSWSQMLNDSPWGSMYEDDGVTLRLSP